MSGPVRHILHSIYRQNTTGPQDGGGEPLGGRLIVEQAAPART
ncbi:hypothetical protein ABZ354_05300 [Streptomyces sp. NPDC005925]